MAVASLINNTIQITQTLLSQIGKSFDFTTENKRHTQAPKEARKTADTPAQPVKKTAHVSINKLIRTAPTTSSANKNKTPMPTEQVTYSVKIFKDTKEKQSGRLALTGRMSDVCAELERMVAYETLHQPKQKTLWH